MPLAIRRCHISLRMWQISSRNSAETPLPDFLKIQISVFYVFSQELIRYTRVLGGFQLLITYATGMCLGNLIEQFLSIRGFVDDGF